MNDTVLIVLVIVFIYIFLFLHKQNVVYIEAYDNTQYLVYKDEQVIESDKANMLAKISENLIILKQWLVANKNNYPEYATYIDQLDRNFKEKKTVIYETDPNSDLTSYSVNKGEELSFCLKSKKTGDLHQINLLMYVAIHELAHIACPEIGHGELFKTIFKKFAEEATKCGVYTKEDFNQNPTEYCGMIVSSSII
jgi:predicted metal-dependent hydrolase